MNVERKMIQATVGGHSLVGIDTETLPVSFGNYFSFTGGGSWQTSLRCINMWKENLEEAAKIFLPDGLIEVDAISDGEMVWHIVVDERIPSEWLTKKPCFTGYGGMSPELFEECKEKYGWGDSY